MQTETNIDSGLKAEDYSSIPADFPRVIQHGAVPGSRLKLLLVQYGDKFYIPGDSPPERFARWQYCEDCAQKLKLKSLESKGGKRAHMTEEEILDQYLVRLLATRWMSPEDAHWSVKRMAELLDWHIPEKVIVFFEGH